MIDSSVFTAFAATYQQNRLDRIKIDNLDVYLASKSRNHNHIKMEIVINIIAREHEAGKSQKQIAEIVSLSQTGVAYHLKKIKEKGLKRNGNRRFKGYTLMKLKEYIIDLQKDGKTHEKIAGIVGIKRATVSQHIKNYNREAENGLE